MISSRKRLAIIPARGGSKRIKNKNIRKFHHRPMIHHTLDYTVKSNLFHTIHVSTDDKDIRKSVLDFGLNIDFERPNHLSGDHTTLFDVLKFTVAEYNCLGQNFDEIWLIMACAPLTIADDLIEAARTFDPNQGLMIAVGEMPVPLEWAYTSHGKNLLKFVQPKGYQFRSQDLSSYYFDAGAFAIFTENQFHKDHFMASPIQPYHLPKHRSVDIDTEDDWVMAEALFRAINTVKE
jgi:N-acylneuraminate cytidylyltransferase